MGCFSGHLMSSASYQKLFCEICSAFNCSFDEFVGEKVVSPSYSSAIFSGQFLLDSSPCVNFIIPVVGTKTSHSGDENWGDRGWSWGERHQDSQANMDTSCFPPVLHPERIPFSQSLSVSPPAHRGWCLHGLLGISSDIGGTRPVLHPGWVLVSQSLSVSPPAHRGWCLHGLLGMSSDIGGTRLVSALLPGLGRFTIGTDPVSNFPSLGTSPGSSGIPVPPLSHLWPLTSSFTFIKRLFSSSSLSVIRVVSSAYLRLLVFLPTIYIPACASSSPAFLMMYSAYKLKSRVTIYSLDILLFLFGTSLLFHVQF